MPNIKPISGLRNYTEVLKEVRENQPVFLPEMAGGLCYCGSGGIGQTESNDKASGKIGGRRAVRRRKRLVDSRRGCFSYIITLLNKSACMPVHFVFRYMVYKF